MSPCYQRHEVAPGVHQDVPHDTCAAQQGYVARIPLYTKDGMATKDYVEVPESFFRGECFNGTAWEDAERFNQRGDYPTQPAMAEYIHCTICKRMEWEVSEEDPDATL